METIRTPDERFVGLPDYDFAPRYATIDDLDGGTLRVHYLDEGPPDAAPVLLMHGEPSWCYLYRKFIGPLVAAGHRVIAPDLVGFGRSDKPTEQADYSYARHVEWMKLLLFDHLDLRDITFLGQDWGSLVGLRLVALAPERYARIALGNGGLPTGDGAPSEAFMNWQKFSQESPVFPIGNIIDGGTVRTLGAEEIAAYDAPFPDDAYKAGARSFPSLVPTQPTDPARDDQLEAWQVLHEFDKPFLCCFSDSDPVTAGGEAAFVGRVPGTAGLDHITVEGAGHFFQEDAPDVLIRMLIDFID